MRSGVTLYPPPLPPCPCTDPLRVGVPAGGVAFKDGKGLDQILLDAREVAQQQRHAIGMLGICTPGLSRL